MIPLEIPFSFLAVVSGIAALALAAYVLARHRTKILAMFIVANSAVFAMTLGFALRSLETGLHWLGEGSINWIAVQGLADLCALLAILVQAAGGMVMTAVLPGLTIGLFEQTPARWQRILGLLSSAVLGLLLVLQLFAGLGQLVGIVASVVLFGNIALNLGLVVVRLRISGRGSGQGRVGPSQADATRWILRFVLTSLVFLPLFILDMLLSQWPANPVFRLLDNTSLPLFFLLVNLGAMYLLYTRLDHPPLMEADKLSRFGREYYQLTEREAAVVEYVLDGFTIKDLAGVLKMAPKTAENHLYSAYQKTGVTNRIQLFQIFQNQRRE